MRQPEPTPRPDLPSVAELVIEDIRARMAVGLERYGTPLTPHNGRDGLRDAYEEALDLAQYIRQELWEREEGSMTDSKIEPRYDEDGVFVASCGCTLKTRSKRTVVDRLCEEALAIVEPLRWQHFGDVRGECILHERQLREQLQRAYDDGQKDYERVYDDRTRLREQLQETEQQPRVPMEDEIEAGFRAAKKPAWDADRRVIERACFSLGVRWAIEQMAPQPPVPVDPFEEHWAELYDGAVPPNAERKEWARHFWEAGRKAKPWQ